MKRPFLACKPLLRFLRSRPSRNALFREALAHLQSVCGEFGRFRLIDQVQRLEARGVVRLRLRDARLFYLLPAERDVWEVLES